MATWTSRCLESEREQRNSGWSRSAHTPIKRISGHRDTISCHPLCCTKDLIDMKGQCCPKIVVSIPRSLFTSGQLRHIVPKTAIPLWRKVCEKEGSWHHKSLQMVNYIDDRSINHITGIWNISLTQTFFLVIAQWRFHSTWSTISFPKIRRKKNINWNLFPHFDAIWAYHWKN